MLPESDDSFDLLAGAAARDRTGTSGANGSAARPGGSNPVQQLRCDEFPFLIAQHAFDAHILDEEKHKRDNNAVCLSFAFGELAYVHFVHSSGWGDVTLVKSGDRGWVPVDYFVPFSDPRALSILAAVAAFLAQPRSQKLYIAPQHIYTFSEAAINEIISGAKLLLSKTNALSRDAALVRKFVDIAAARKSLLNELAHLVHIAKHNKHTANAEVIEKLLRGCFRLLERTLALLKAVDEHQPAKSDKNKQTHARLSSTSSSKSTASSAVSENSNRSAFSSLEGYALYRMNSFNDYPSPPAAEPRLHEVITAFTSYLDYFLDPNEVLLANPDSPSTPSVILALTRHCMLACRELLVIVDVITDTVPNSQDTYKDGKEALLEEIRRLVGCARSVVASLPPSPSTLRTAAAQSMSQCTARCRTFALKLAQISWSIIKSRQDLELPERAYPIFKIEPMQHAETQANLDSQTLTNTVASLDIQRISSSSEKSTEKSTETSTETLITEANGGDIHSLNSPPANSNTEPKKESQEWDDSTNCPQKPHTVLQSGLSELDLRKSTSSVSPKTTPTETPHMGSSLNLNETDTITESVETCDGDSNLDEFVMRNGKVRGGSLAALVQWLTGDTYIKLEFEIRTFLTCFRLFASPRDVVIELGSHGPSPGTQHFAKLWVESFWELEDGVLVSLETLLPASLAASRRQLDKSKRPGAQVVYLPVNPPGRDENSQPQPARSFSGTSNYSLNSLSPQPRRNHSFGSQFASQSALNIAASFREFGLQARRASRQVSNDESRMARLRSGSHVGLVKESEPFHVITSDAAEHLLAKPVSDIASQLTLMWSGIFQMLRPSELLDQRFSSSKRSLGLAPHATQLISLSNHLTAFIGDTILSPELSTKQRARVLKLWIRIADEFFNHGNLNGCVTVILTLQSTRIMRLSKAWELLSSKTSSIFMKLVPLISPERNFQDYRRELRSRSGYFCVPYMGLLLADLTFIDEGNPKTLRPSGAINFDRYCKAMSAIGPIQAFQQVPFEQATADISLQAWLRGEMAKSHSQESRDSEEQWRRSLLIQPED